MENPNSTWNEFSTRIIQRNEPSKTSFSFLNDEEQNKAQSTTLGQKMKNLRHYLQEPWGNAIEGSSQPIDPNPKRRQNATRFCNYCRTIGHTPIWCHKKIEDERLKQFENKRTAKKVTFTQDHNRKQGRSHWSEQLTSGQEIRPTVMIDLWETRHWLIRISFPKRTLQTGLTIWTWKDYRSSPKLNTQLERWN